MRNAPDKSRQPQMRLMMLMRMNAFRREESGSMIVFTLFILIMMLMVGGMAVDMMRFETYRAKLQSTLDRAVLAAADLDVCLAPNADPRAIVMDHLAKQGFADQLISVVVQPGLGSCSVTANAMISVNTIFMQMVNVDALSTPAISAATEEVDQIEISLVLDISGSMRFDSRMDRLRPAASEFVTTVLNAAQPQTLSINLVPYAGQTNPGPVMFDYLNGVRYAQPMIPDLGTPDPNDQIAFPVDSSCLEVPSSGFGPDLPTFGLLQTPMFMNWNIARDVMDWGWCPNDGNSIIYASDNVGELTGRINSMRMHDGTGTHYAMRWAVSLLNPSAAPAFAHLAANGQMPSHFGSSRPMAFNSPEGMKVIVLMTDGQITEQVRPADYQHALNPYTELQRRPSNQRTNITSASQNVNSFYSMCNAAKANGVVIFTIAFDAPGAAATQMANCASSASHFYNVNGLEIGDAFRSIAGQINQLRLVQ